MKRFVVILIVFLVSFLNGCIQENKIAYSSIEDNDIHYTSTTTIVNVTSTTVSSDKALVKYINNSDYDVNVYHTTPPHFGGKAKKVSKHSYAEYIEYPEKIGGDVFYFEYLIPVGDIVFPYCDGISDTGYKTTNLSINCMNEVIIEPLEKCNTENSYLILDNQTTSDIYLSLCPSDDVSYPRIPYGRTPKDENKYIMKGDSCLYLIESVSERKQLLYQDIDSLKIQRNATNKMAFPIRKADKGMIYTITVTNDAAVLKSVTPFDIDLQNQIWSVDCNYNQYKLAEVCRSKSKDGGCVLVGKNQSGKIFVKVLDKYGDKKNEYEIPILTLRTYRDQAVVTDTTGIHNVLENDDGTIVIFATIEYQNEDVTDDTLLFCYDPQKKGFKWGYNLADCIENYEISVNDGAQNTIVKRSDNIYAIACGVLSNVSGNFCVHLFFAEFDCSTPNNISVRTYISSYTSDSSDDNVFWSVYFDGTDYIVVGSEVYDDKDYGVIYRIKSDVSGDLTADKIYSKENYHFSAIDGSGTDYYICGEYVGFGGISHGCYLTSSMVSHSDYPIDCIPKLEQSYFEYITICNNRILVSGRTWDVSVENSYPIVTAFDFNNNILWHNSFDSLYEIYSCYSNGIGSYLIELYSYEDDADGNQISEKSHIVSADLMGRDTGECVLTLE